MKEIQFRPNTQLHDIKHKINRIPEWFEDGEKVKLVIRFSGREIAHPETGKKLLDLITGMIDNKKIDKGPSVDGKTLWVVLAKEVIKTSKHG